MRWRDGRGTYTVGTWRRTCGPRGARRGGYGDFEAWDVPFYTNMIMVQRQHRRWREDAAGADYGDDHDNASQFPGYFTVENGIGGMKRVKNSFASRVAFYVIMFFWWCV